MLNIHSLKGLHLVVRLIGNKLKTPKAYQLNSVIDYLNKHGFSLCYVKLTEFDLNNPWFAGFGEADGSFGIDLRLKPRLKCACQFQINQRLQDPKTCLDYWDIFQKISQTLGVKTHKLKEKRSGLLCNQGQ